MSEKLITKKLILEAIFIILSVFVGIALESFWQATQEKNEAHEAFSQVIIDMKTDLENTKDIQVVQNEVLQQYMALQKLLLTYKQHSSPEIDSLFNFLFTNNNTLFPRRSSWMMMVQSGTTTNIENKKLILDIGDLYEKTYTRIIYNGTMYDEELFGNLTDVYVNKWSVKNKMFNSTSIEDVITSIHHIRIAWTEYYLTMLKEYEKDLKSLILRSETYMADAGYENLID